MVWGGVEIEKCQIDSIGENYISFLLDIGKLGVYQVDEVFAVMSGVGRG